ncbi:MAG: DNA topoisomerase IV [Spirochaetes bacterium GWD1_27_9]|nr:MAG: DNA topoisomerase IV [Spirochaetes bacterium GWB1_27_13]OHD23468.1 MAG: DNA topoisomerase IV [Spirochaetes bacterium GWC1_27_15]OHD44296.1 MAG: DNA topoisomerase IV [Spirochaetes bacterium GWD1_27_9]
MLSAKTMISTNFIEYASYVIKDRAIPDIDDGLKPVQRRIFHSLFEMDDGKYHKVANIVGNTMKYHPHGDASIYSSLVVVANKELFIDTQGNFGNIFTGDEASAARYIECRLNSLAKEVLFNKEITEYVDSYDGRNKEPVALPAKIPNLLLMGAEGIAVGMATKILPHNFNELLNAQIKILKNQKYEVYPDFQQCGILDVTDYNLGNGKVRVRAVIEVANEKTLLIKEIPFGTTTESLIASVDNAAKKGKIKISSINDFTAEKVEIEIKLARGENADDTLKALFAYTDCEISISVNLILIQDNKPRQMTVNEVLEYNTKKLVSDLNKELEIEKNKLEQRLHNLTLERIFIENRIYKKIEEVTTYEKVISVVETEMNKFKKMFIRELTKEDIEKLLEIKIKRISLYDIENHKKNIDDIVRNLQLVNERLKDIKKYTIEYITNLLAKYGKNYPRKTKIKKFETIDVKEIAQPDIKVYWDKQSGFLGTDVKGEDSFTVSQFEKFLIINTDATYKVIGIDSKTFIDTNAIYVDVFNPKKHFAVIYTDLETTTPYAKKFKIEKFLTNKVYQLSPSGKGKLEYIGTNVKAKVKVFYKKKPKQKVNEEVFDFSKLEEKGVLVWGNRVATKEIEKVEG